MLILIEISVVRISLASLPLTLPLHQNKPPLVVSCYQIPSREGTILGS